MGSDGARSGWLSHQSAMPRSTSARAAFSAFVRSDLWQPARWPDPDAVRSPSKSIAGFAAEERRREAEIRREVEASYDPGVLYGEAIREESA